MFDILIAYITGTLVGLYLTHRYRSGIVDSVIETLIDQRFLKIKIDQNGHTDLVKWQESNTSTDK